MKTKPTKIPSLDSDLTQIDDYKINFWIAVVALTVLICVTWVTL